MHVGGKPVCAYDPEGMVFAVGVQSDTILVYDARAYDKGPFSKFLMEPETRCEWTGLRFSPNGQHALLSTNGNVMRLLDAFKGSPVHTFTGHLNNRGVALDGCFSPDSQYVFSGSTDGRVHSWKVTDGYKVCVLNGGHVGPVQCVQFNPAYLMMASACTHLNFWLPREETPQ
jgi:COMPASS component SWD2